MLAKSENDCNFAYTNMKQTLLIAFLSAMTAQLHAATVENGYHPMLCDGKVWNYTYHAHDGDRPMSVEVDGDTVVGSTACKKLYLRLPDSRRLYGCYSEQSGIVSASLTMQILKEDGRLSMQPLASAAPSVPLFLFMVSGGVSWTVTHILNGLLIEMDQIAAKRLPGYDRSALESYPKTFVPGVYELVSSGSSLFARVQMTDFLGRDTLETWVSGVGDRLWGIMQPVADVGESCGGEWVEFESCAEDGQVLFTKDGFTAEPLRSDYRPFVEAGKTWTCSVNPSGADIYYFCLQGDTVVGGRDCVKLYSRNRDNDGTTVYEGAWYESDKRVYRYLPGTAQPLLYYDFSLRHGDEATLDRAVVSGVHAATEAYELYNGRLLRTIVFYEYTEGYGPRHYEQRPGSWTEGVGPTYMLDVVEHTGFNLMGGRYGDGIIDCSVGGSILYRDAKYGQLTAGVGAVTSRAGESSAVFDLQGRRVQGEPRKGVYIQGGRKYVVR